ncbi:MAG: putative lipid II flippase FtsW [Anaerolineae bacterium]|nr:MAG: putative lipid II flippase FtsW [Anaerolineae bacterium]
MSASELIASRQSRLKERGVDYPLVVIVVALLLIGLMMVFSATFDLGAKAHDNPVYFFIRQVVWTALGGVLAALLARVEYRQWRRHSITLMALTLVMLVAVFVMGAIRFGAQRTLWAGSIQPSEFAKLIIIIYVADWVSSKGERIKQVTYGLIPFAILIGAVAALIVSQPDISTAIIIVLTAVVMFFTAGADILQLIIGFAFGSAAFALLISRSPHALDRVAAYLATLNDPYTGSSYQVREALTALGLGGLTGQGLGMGTQKLNALPLPHTDTIFAVLGEELGLMGTMLVIGLFAALAYRGFKIALEAPDSFGAVLAAGTTFALLFQALINIAVITATLPFTGIPLPFISYGGSSMIVSLSSVGILLGVSRGKIQKESRRRAHHYLGRGDGRARISRADRRPRTARRSPGRRSSRQRS